MIKERLYLLYSALIVLYILNVFINSSAIHYINGLLGILAIAVSFKGTNRLFQSLGLFFIVCGLFFFSYAGLDWMLLPTYITSMMPVIGIMLVLPLINLVVLIGRFDKNMHKILTAKVEHLDALYRRSYVTTYVFAMFLYIATLPLIHSVLSKSMASVPGRETDQVMSRTIVGGFSLVTLWSPMDALVATIIDFTEVDYISYFPWLLLCSLLILGIECLRSFKYKKIPIPFEGGNGKIERKVFRQIGVMLLAMLCFLGSVLLVGQIPNVSFLLAVTIVIVPFSIVWAFLLGKIRTFSLHGMKVWKQKSNHLNHIVFLFLPLGFATATLGETVFIDYIRGPFMIAADYPIMLFIMFQIIYIIMALLGFHALVATGILIGIISPLLEVINPLSIGISLITCGVATTLIAPGGVTLNIMGDLLRINPFRIAGWNFMFALLFGCIGVAVATILL